MQIRKRGDEIKKNLLHENSKMGNQIYFKIAGKKKNG
jgi:hypothetical protein